MRVESPRSADSAIGDRRTFRRRVAIAPVCLCLVALLHVYRVGSHDQTPWKGGGFGMFSTVDQRSARYLRAYLVTDQGEIPVAIPTRWEKRATELCAAPDAAGLARLAGTLAKTNWHDASQRWESIALARATTAGAEPLNGEMLHRAVEAPTLPPDPFGTPLDVVPVAPSDQPSYKLALIPVREVRLELWRYAYEADSLQLRGRKFLEASASRQGDA